MPSFGRSTTSRGRQRTGIRLVFLDGKYRGKTYITNDKRSKVLEVAIVCDLLGNAVSLVDALGPELSRLDNYDISKDVLIDRKFDELIRTCEQLRLRSKISLNKRVLLQKYSGTKLHMMVE